MKHFSPLPAMARLARAPRTAPRGFTLVELLVVLVVLTLLAGIVGPRILGQLGGAKSKTAIVQIAEIEKALEIYALDVGRFPSTAQGLQALVQAPSGATGWNGPYVKGGVPLDPPRCRRRPGNHLLRRGRRARRRGRKRGRAQYAVIRSNKAN